MTPMYCDVTGKLITPKFGTVNPEPNRDYFLVNNKVVSEEGYKQIQAVVTSTLDQSYRTMKYNFRSHQQVWTEAIKQLANKMPSELPRSR